MDGPGRGADAVVVGGGIAGAATAHFLAEGGARVLLLEQERALAHHTTGRSAALYLANYGPEPVRRLTLASRAFLSAPEPDLVEVPLLTPRPALDIVGPDAVAAAREHAGRGAALVPSIRLLGSEQAAAQCPVLRVDRLGGAVLDPEAMDIDVMALHQGFLRGLRRHGGEVRTTAQFVSASRSGTGWVVRTTQGDVAASVLVNAAGAWGDVVAQRAGLAPVGLRPLRRTAFTVALPPGMDARGWPLVQELSEGWYFKPEGAGLLCSPGDEVPEAPGDPRPRDEDVALAIDWINGATTLGLRRVQAAWAGLRTFAPDRLPIVGDDPDAPGFVWAVGLGGFGIMTAPAVGMLAAAGALGAPLPAALIEHGVRPIDCSAARLR